MPLRMAFYIWSEVDTEVDILLCSLSLAAGKKHYAVAERLALTDLERISNLRIR